MRSLPKGAVPVLLPVLSKAEGCGGSEEGVHEGEKYSWQGGAGRIPDENSGFQRGVLHLCDTAGRRWAVEGAQLRTLGSVSMLWRVGMGTETVGRKPRRGK